ncbi:MAG: preprotein translocase subunit SecG, partial [Spirochaetales bacterium]|nr:preprotein translocase subunit SecG [Spirochaetales bacterium]
MGVLSVIIMILFVIVSLLLIFLVAIQDEQSEGLGGIFGGGS